MKKSYFVGIMILVFSMAVVIGSVTRNLLMKEEPVKVIEIKRDTLPLENSGEIVLEIEDGREYIRMQFINFEYIVRKKSLSKKTVKSLQALFYRLSD